MVATAGSLEGRLRFLLVPDTEAGSGVGALKQRVTLGHILRLGNCDVGRLDDQTCGPAFPGGGSRPRAWRPQPIGASCCALTKLITGLLFPHELTFGPLPPEVRVRTEEKRFARRETTNFHTGFGRG